MKTLLFLLVFAVAVAAQSQSVQCGTPAGVAANSAPTGRASSVAAKPSAAVGNIAAQIQQRRPAPIRPPSTCRCGTVAASSLNSPSNSQEVPILTGLAGSFRFDHVMVQETAQFASDSVGSLVVGVGRPKMGPDVVSPFPLKSDFAPYSFWYERPTPPQLTGAYDLVLNFKGSSNLGDGAASNFSAGTVTWEVCGYNGAAAAVK